MQISNITEKDAVLAAKAAQFMAFSVKFVDALRLAGIPIEGPGIREKEIAMVWLADLANNMANEYRASKVPVVKPPRPKVKVPAPTKKKAKK